MGNLLLMGGRIAGIVGVLLGAFSVVSRLQGSYLVGGFQIGTLLQASIAAMVLGCLCYVAAIAERQAR